MELDLDSFLRSRGDEPYSVSSDEKETPDTHRRTIDEILNESDSDSSSSSETMPSISRVLSNGDTFRNEELGFRTDVSHWLGVAETLTESSSNFKWRGRSDKLSSSAHPSYLGYEIHSNASSSSSSSHLFPSLLSGMRPKPKPGAALAAAAAASRSVPTPHAAAIKSKRASDESILKVSLPHVTAEDRVMKTSLASNVLDEHDFSSAPSSAVVVGGNEDAEGIDLVKFSLPSRSSSLADLDVAENVLLHKEDISYGGEHSLSVTERDTFENLEEDFSCSINEPQTSLQFESKEDTEDAAVNIRKVTNNLLVVQDANAENVFSNNEAELEGVGSELCRFDNEVCSDATSSSVREESRMLSKAFSINEAELEGVGAELGRFDNEVCSDETSNSVREESRMLSKVNSFACQIMDEKGSTKDEESKSRTRMKPLDCAEELEKRKASSGLHWEEGAAAQPMRLEGIRRGPPAIGYLQMDLDNKITRSVSSQMFKHDYGLPHVLAVHMNFIALGTSKGIVLVFPCKYSPHHTDNMDEKMLIFGSSSEKIPIPVTSMCFNQQGDLLLVGYNDGHLTIWDVHKGSSAKVITGEHNAPITHTLFLEQDSQVSRQFKAVTSDSKGLVLLHTSSVLPLLNHFSIKTQCILDGQKNGTVLCASPILIYNSQDVGSTSAQVHPSVPSSGQVSKVGGVVSDTGWKLFSGNPSVVEEGVVVLATKQNALVVRLSPTVEIYENLPRPDGVSEGSMPYAAWKCMGQSYDSSAEASDKIAWLAIAWDRKIQIASLVKSQMKSHKEWILDSTAIGVVWLDDQILVALTIRGQLCLFSRDGAELHRTNLTVDCTIMDSFIIYHTHYMNTFGNPEKSYHNSVAVRGASIYILGPMHLIISRLLPWKERIQVLQKAGDWMGALDMAMRLYDGHAHGVIDLPRTVDTIREAIMPYLLELILLYVDEVFSYISVAFNNQIDKVGLTENPNIKDASLRSEIMEQYARVGGVAVEFCVHIKRTDILFNGIFTKFVAVHHEGTFLELLEPYILRDMLGFLPPEIMQALVEYYSSKGWLERVEQCVLHMDISSLDFNQVMSR